MVQKTGSRLKHIRTIGSFVLITCILGQLIGLYSAFASIKQTERVSQTLLAAGLKFSMLTTIYGTIIFMLSLII
ncbi:MotA/TolQ/ExbB proton channel family protein [Maribellus maritimus]|uniref:MotA/TolQ/ExbB proton channel family protein n=1 Tax=Maribellus maritimus TaxID=2870838 RepID=UPI001EEC22C0|nr:MotA/TolQ/ExbB proton channel family protein [Maribellus maritimus]MCG6186747.1 MotA/TolQ/ExbB proton channel family protein [Maribellus maritimus]